MDKFKVNIAASPHLLYKEPKQEEIVYYSTSAETGKTEEWGNRAGGGKYNT